MDLFTLSAKLQLDKSDYDKGLQESESMASKVGGSIMNGFGTMVKVGAAGMATIGAATAGATGAIVKGTSELAEYGDNIDKMSQKMGISAEAYQEWDAIMQHSGTSIDSMSRGMQTLQKNAVNSAEKFEALGITQEQLANMSTEELFSATITGLQNMGEGAERTALASELLGGSAKELGALLNTSAEDTEAMRQRVHELGGVMSDDAVKAAASFQDSLQDMKTGLEGLKKNMLSNFLPATTKVMDGLTAIFAGDFDEGLEQISEGITEFVDNISEKLPEVMELGGAIIETLATAIIDNLPALFEAGMNMIGRLGEGILESVPQMLSTALTLMETFATGLIESVPEIIPAIVDMIMQIVNTLTQPDNLVKLIMAAVQLAIAIATGLLQAIPQIIQAIPQIIENLVIAIVELLPLLIGAGVQLLGALVEGIMSIAGSLFDAARDLINRFIDTIVEVGMQLVEKGKDLITNVINGIKAMFENVKQKGKETVDKIITGIKGQFSAMVQKGKDLIQKVIDGIAGMFTSLVEKGKAIVDNVKSGFMEKVEEAKDWGKDLIQNFIDGVLAKWESLKQTVSNVAQSVKDFLGFSEPKMGPLSNFHTYAPDMMDLFMKGINDNKDKLINTVQSAFDFQDLITAPVIGGVAVENGVYGAVGARGDMIFNININQPMKDATDVAKAIREEAQYGLLGG